MFYNILFNVADILNSDVEFSEESQKNTCSKFKRQMSQNQSWPVVYVKASAWDKSKLKVDQRGSTCTCIYDTYGINH